MTLYQLQTSFDDDGVRAQIRRLRQAQPRGERSVALGVAILIAAIGAITLAVMALGGAA